MPSDMNIKAIDYALTEHPFLGSGFGIPMIKASSEIQYFNVATSNIIFGMIIFTGINRTYFMYDIHASYGTFSYFSNEFYYFIIFNHYLC